MQANDLDLLLKNQSFEHYYQPIFEMNNVNPIGRESLLRTKVGTPDIIFQNAKKLNRLYDIDTLSINKAIKQASAHKKRREEELLFVNVFPSTVIEPLFPAFIEQVFNEHPTNCKQIVFELNEAEKIVDINLLKERISFLKRYGCQIAFDDVGKGWSSLDMIIEVEPDYLKLDRYFSNDLSNSTKKQAMVSAVSSYCKANNINFILEGIETLEDLQTAQNLGINMAQGYYLGRPAKI